MKAAQIGHEATLWMVNDIPSRLVYAARRWRVTDTPTRLRESVWTAPLDDARRPGLYGWRFQAVSTSGDVRMFDVYRDEDHWHVHRVYD